MNARLIAAVFARGGSKGLPGKNLMKIHGIPLVEVAIRQALQVDGIDEVYLSTDSAEIADIGRSAGALVPFIRPAELASDSSPEWLSWRHLVSYVAGEQGAGPSYLVSVPATAPLRLPADIEGCISVALGRPELDGALCVTPSKVHPDFNLLRKSEDGVVSIFTGSSADTLPFRRQDSEVAWEIVPSAYCIKTDFIMTARSMWHGRLGGYAVPNNRAVDIDSQDDFRVAELFFDPSGL